MSWTRAAEYYRLLNEAVARRLGGPHSARVLLHSVDFAEIAGLQRESRWEEAGAEAVVLATNTMHRVAPQIEGALGVPFLHIADAAGRGVRAAGVRRVGLLATAFTMEQPFYRERLEERHGLEVLVPGADERAEVHRIIFDELCRGVLRDESRETYRRVMAGLVARGAGGLILGCTEITLLVRPGDASVPTFDTTGLHVREAADFLLGGPPP